MSSQTSCIVCQYALYASLLKSLQNCLYSEVIYLIGLPYAHPEVSQTRSNPHQFRFLRRNWLIDLWLDSWKFAYNFLHPFIKAHCSCPWCLQQFGSIGEQSYLQASRRISLIVARSYLAERHLSWKYPRSNCLGESSWINYFYLQFI